MNELLVLPPPLAGALTVAEIDATMAYAEAEKAASTRRCYASDWRHFSIWCLARGATPLPALSGMVAAYFSSLAQAGLKASTIGRRAAAIAYRHRQAGLESPVNAEGVRATLRGIRRVCGVTPDRKAALTAAIVRQMLDGTGERLIDLRDRALLSFGLASAMRRSELCALQVADLELVADGLRVLIRRSKTDQSGEGQLIAVPRGLRIRPVEHVTTWMEAAGITEGPVFRSVTLGGKASATGLTGWTVSEIIKKHVVRLGLDPAVYAGHSLRSGFVTQCIEANAPLLKICEVTRHKSLTMLQVYSRRRDLFVDHAGASFL
jgi:site-specific recombinase XerD